MCTCQIDGYMRSRFEDTWNLLEHTQDSFILDLDHFGEMVCFESEHKVRLYQLKFRYDET